MKVIIIISTLVFAYSQCDNYADELQCNSNSDCEWIEDVQYVWCGSYDDNPSECNSQEGCAYSTCSQPCNFGGSQECESHPGCSYSYLTYSCSGTTTVPCCSGGSYQNDNSYCQEIEVLECFEMNQLQCFYDDGCDWMESGVESGSCSNLNTYSQCNEFDDCNWTSYQCSGTGYSDCISQPGCSYSWLTYSCTGTVSYCGGGYYEIPIFECEEVESLACSEMNQVECSQNGECDWMVDIEYGNCSNLGSSSCDANPNCWGAYTNPGWYYGWYCAGGSYTIDDSYCFEMEDIFGDVNGDGTLNVSDIVLIVDLILNSEFDELSDITQDGVLNVLDIIELINSILE